MSGTVKAQIQDRGFVPVDLVLLVYMAITGLVLVISPHTLPGKTAYGVLHFTLMAVIATFRFLPRTRGPLGLVLVRHWYPIVCLPFMYGALRILNRMITTSFYDDRIVQAEQAVFGYHPSQELFRLVPSRLLSEFAHFSYAFYICLIPLVAGLLFWRYRERALAPYVTSISLVFSVCYFVFITFPVVGPYHYFGPIDPSTKQGVFCYLVERMLANGSSEGTAFPSSHVAVAFCIWAVSRPYLGRLSWGVLAIAIGILVGTVYGGFHYAVDALAGLPIGLAGGLLGPRFHVWLSRKLGYVPDLPYEDEGPVTLSSGKPQESQAVAVGD